MLELEQAKTDETSALIVECAKLVIFDAESYRRAAEKRSMLGEGIEYFENLFRPHVEQAHRQHKALLADLKKFTEPLQAAMFRLGRQLADYDAAQQLIQRRKQLEAEAEERKRAEEEKKRLADLAKEMGDRELAEEIKAAPAQVEPVVVAKETPKIEGLSYRENWTYKIVDASKIPCRYHSIDTVEIGRIVRRLKGETKIPGVEVICERIAVQK